MNAGSPLRPPPPPPHSWGEENVEGNELSLVPVRPDGGDGGPRKRLRDKAEAAEDAMVPHEPLSRVMRRALKPNTHVERSAVRTVQVRACVCLLPPLRPRAAVVWARACVRRREDGGRRTCRSSDVCACACAFARARLHVRVCAWAAGLCFGAGDGGSGRSHRVRDQERPAHSDGPRRPLGAPGARCVGALSAVPAAFRTGTRAGPPDSTL